MGARRNKAKGPFRCTTCAKDVPAGGVRWTLDERPAGEFCCPGCALQAMEGSWISTAPSRRTH